MVDTGASSTSKRRDRPPVKSACLACRASRTRCDGLPLCTPCAKKNRTCSYTKSKRGGPRVCLKKNHTSPSSSALEDILMSGSDLPRQSLFDGFDFDNTVLPMISPGAGLKQLDSDRIFDSIFGRGPEESEGSSDGDSEQHADSETPTVRSYRTDAETLNAYYVYIHPYFPILPPPETLPVYDSVMTHDSDGFVPASPISLAISAILALIPHPRDPDPQSERSVLERREQAQLFAQLTLESIEIEAEVLASGTSPAEALSSDPSTFHRQPFHSRTPIELESLLAFLVLSIYEYAQRGNLVKMRNRASQAHDAATRLSLHEDSESANDEKFGEARKRAWWMTYVCVLQGSIVSSTAPIIPVDFRQFRTPLPTNATDPNVWSEFLDAQHCILKCTRFTVALKKALSLGSDLAPIQRTMLILDQEVDNLLANADFSSLLLPTFPDGNLEHTLATSLRSQAQIKLNSAKIKLHRHRAFQDVPVFTKRHCDLDQIDDRTRDHRSRDDSVIGCCDPSLQASFGDTRSTSRTGSSTSSEMDLQIRRLGETSSVESIASARCCMKAALAIGKAFESLPYPDPTLCLESALLSPSSSQSQVLVPRTMPAFACCAMQGSYALLMLCNRSHTLDRTPPATAAFYDGVEELYSGLERILAALRNYSIAFEALDGMRGQIQEAYNTARIRGRAGRSS